jgi:putative ABC transport system permease protein
VLDVDGGQMEAVRFDVGYDYVETMGLRLTEGRPLSRERGDGGAVLVNEAFVAQRGWDAPVGQTVALREDSLLTSYTVAGVLEDFHYDSFFDPIDPVMMRVAKDDALRYLALRVRPGRATETFADVEAAWARLVPEHPFEGYFQDTVFDDFHRENAGINRIFVFTAAMALLLATMGLFGIAAQNVARRMREIGIRKVLGATVTSVAAHVNRSFVAILVLAFVVAAPLSYLILDGLLDAIFEYRMPLNPLPFLLAFGVVALAALATIGTQVRRIVTANPADVLRAE